MTRQEWLLVLLPLISTWTLDRSSKLWALMINQPIRLGYIEFSLHYNPGAMLGLFSNLPAVLRIVSLSTAGAFLVCIYLLIQYLLPIKSLTLRAGLSVLLGGILGNVTDRILMGHVVDFIILRFDTFYSPVFNVADALQWFGYVLIVYAVIREGDLLWPENNVRKRYWVNTRFQLKYSFLLMAIGLGIALIASIFSYTYLKVTITELVGTQPKTLERFLMPFLETFLLMTIGISLALFSAGKIISHRMAGPLYAFERYVDLLLNSETTHFHKFKLRTNDEFKHLETLADRLKTRIEQSQTQTQSQTYKNETEISDSETSKSS